jgi:hypothetical protein
MSEKNILLLEMVNDQIRVQIEGNGGDLSSMIASAIIEDPSIDELFKAAMFKVVMQLREKESEDDYIEQLIKNGVSAQA